MQMSLSGYLGRGVCSRTSLLEKGSHRCVPPTDHREYQHCGRTMHQQAKSRVQYFVQSADGGGRGLQRQLYGCTRA